MSFNTVNQTKAEEREDQPERWRGLEEFHPDTTHNPVKD